jgi:hypothetical protein
MGDPAKHSQFIKVEFIDVAPGPRVIIQKQKFSLGIRITNNDNLINGLRKQIRLFVMFKGVDYAKMQRRCTLRQTPENAECNLILRELTMDELPPCITKNPDLEIKFRVQIPLPGTKKKEALSETFHLVEDAEYAKLYYDISESEVVNEMNTTHCAESTEQRTESHVNGWKWDFVEQDRQLLQWAMKW